MSRPTTPQVLRVYRAADAAQLAEGLRWYHNAHAVAQTLDPDRPGRAAGVIAALSPRLSWPRNLELAGRAYADGRASGTLGMSCRAADAVLSGADPLDVLRGPKVRAFYSLILDPGDPLTVCIDRHAVDVATGQRLTDAARSAVWPLERRGLYEVFARCYRRAAGVLGVSPWQVQAVTWLTWRAQLRPSI